MKKIGRYGNNRSHVRLITELLAKRRIYVNVDFL